MDSTPAEAAASTEAQSKLISVVLSFRNEDAVLEELIRRLEAALDPVGYDYELIFINDASSDRSHEILLSLLESDPHLRLLNTSSRFGVVPCIYAGFERARGDAVVTMDCDLQDPPEILPEMLAKWAAGADVVHGTRSRRHGESFIKMLVTKWAYRVINALADIELPVDTGLYKVMDRRIIDHLLLIPEQDPYLRGLVAWVGFKQEHVFYEREARFAGKTHFPLISSNPIRTFAVAVMSSSRVPLATILALGMILTSASAVVLAGMLLAAIFGSGAGLAYFAFTVLVLLGGIQLLALGVLGLYLGRVYRQTRGRPHYIIESAVGFEVATKPEDGDRA